MEYLLSPLRFFYFSLQQDFSTPLLARPSFFSRMKYSAQENSKQIFNSSNKTPIIFTTILLVFVMVFGFQKFFFGQPAPEPVSQANEQVNVSGPSWKKNINKTYSFPLRDGSGKEVSKIIYTIESIEVRDEIIVRGQKATAVNGRSFLVINIKLTNNFDQPITVNAKDYLRVILDGSSEKIAPDMHSDPVEVQAISTKVTRLGMTIDDSVKKIILQVGEITGEKESLPITLE